MSNRTFVVGLWARPYLRMPLRNGLVRVYLRNREERKLGFIELPPEVAADLDSNQFYGWDRKNVKKKLVPGSSGRVRSTPHEGIQSNER